MREGSGWYQLLPTYTRAQSPLPSCQSRTSQDLSSRSWQAPQLFLSGKRRAVPSGDVFRPHLQIRGPALASVAQAGSPPTPGPPSPPTGAPDTALTAQQQQQQQQWREAERCWPPGAGHSEPRSTRGALHQEPGHHALGEKARRGGGVELARAGAPISLAGAAGSRAASSEGLGKRRPRGGRAAGGVTAAPAPGARASLRLARLGPLSLPAGSAGLDSSPYNPRTGIHFPPHTNSGLPASDEGFKCPPCFSHQRVGTSCCSRSGEEGSGWELQRSPDALVSEAGGLRKAEPGAAPARYEFLFPGNTH